jgi:hypothetical protein
MDPLARDFLTDSECAIELANIYTVRIWRVHDSILMEDAMTELHGRRLGDQSLPTVPSGQNVRYLHSCRLDDRSRTASTTAGS